MKRGLALLDFSLIALLAASPRAIAQSQEIQPAQVGHTHVPAAPAPRRDIDGVWAGPLIPGLYEVPPMTPWGQEQLKANRPTGGKFTVAESNDPLVTCDPLGFPRNVLFETRGIEFVSSPTKMFELFQYQRVWREIWTDGRALPKNVGGTAGNAPDPRYYGYSVGHWDGDYTFAIDTVGTDERTWLDNQGDPHSGDLRAEERYTRLDHDALELTVKIDDPKAYTKPWVAAKARFLWHPKQEFEEQLCIPSEAADYLNIIASPAGERKK